MSFIKEDKGKIKDIPLTVRKYVYNFLKEIDFDKVDEILDINGGGVISEEVNGLQIAIFKDSIMIFVKMKYYDFDNKELTDDKILTFKIKRNEIESLCK
jgi:hypothetical protein